jgi:hypothetical protein
MYFLQNVLKNEEATQDLQFNSCLFKGRQAQTPTAGPRTIEPARCVRMHEWLP